MRSPLTMERFQDLRGVPVYSSEREKIGSVEHVYYNVESNEPEWMAIGAGILSNRYLMVPLRGAAVERDGVYVPFTKDQVKGSPDIVPDAVSTHLEKELGSYYGEDWNDEQRTEYREPARPVHDPEYGQTRVRRWNWENAPR